MCSAIFMFIANTGLLSYGTRRIADVVTGKLDVSEVAASIPDETEDPEQFDDAEAMAGDDEEGKGMELDGATEEIEA